jgi:transketolase
MWDNTETGAAQERAWRARMQAYRSAYPAAAANFERRMRGELPPDFDELVQAALVAFDAAPEAVASRKSSHRVLAVLAPLLPEMLGGSADLTGSNLTDFPGCGDRHISYGVREFGMAAVMNGVALHGGFIPYGGTFLTFSDYSRNAIRMAALMKKRVIHVFTHDSIGLGEDGPTHQSVEHVPSLRLIPNLDVWRPADTVETAVAWAAALRRHEGPAALALSRQVLPVAARLAHAPGIARGGYVLAEAAGGAPRAVLIGTGSELQLALKAQALLAAQGVPVRVVSMPCTNVFDRQDRGYQDAVLPRGLPAVAVEAAQPDFWRKYVGREGGVVGMTTYGESAPAPALYAHFGITAERVAQAVQRCLGVENRAAATAANGV